MIPDPISYTDRGQNGPVPKCELTFGQFQTYAKRARWDDRSISLFLKTRDPNNKDRIMCGGRSVRLLGCLLAMLISFLAQAQTTQPGIVFQNSLRDSAIKYNTTTPAKVSAVVVRYIDGVDVTLDIPVPTTAPATQPASVTVIGKDRDAKSLDDVDLNSKPNWTYRVEGVTVARKTQWIKRPGVIIEGADNNAAIDVGLHWKESLLVFSDTARDCTVRRLIITGHDGTEFVNLQGTVDFSMLDVNEFIHPSHKGGITPLAMDGSKGLTVRRVVTDGVGRYGIWGGNGSKRGNVDVLLEDCKLGPCALREAEKSSGADKDTNSLNGGAKYEHPARFYGVQNFTANRCQFINPNNAKNSFKLMNGAGATLTDCTFDGISRWGRDVNDPSDYTLQGVTITRGQFKSMIRIDPGANVTASNSTLTKYQVEPKGTLHLVNDKVGGQSVTKTVKK